MISYKQLFLADIFTDCQNKFDNNKFAFLSLLDETIYFDKIVLDASKFTRFNQDFLSDLQSMFDDLINLTELICQRIDKKKAAMPFFDTSGLEAYVTENNPKYPHCIIKQLKSFKEANSLDGSMSPHVAANPAIQQCISMVISIMPLNSASSQTDLAFPGISPFITRTF